MYKIISKYKDGQFEMIDSTTSKTEANNGITNPDNEIPCSLELDYEFQYQSE